MRTLEELLLLASESLNLWLRGFQRLGFWYCLGWIVHILCVVGSVLLGPVSQILATVVFVVGVLALVTSLVLMIHALEPRLHAPAAVSLDGENDLKTASVTIPRLVFQAQQRVPVVAAAIGPFLAVYAVWGLIDEQVELLFSYNLLLRGQDTADYWSISLKRVSFYIVLAAVSFVLKRLVDVLQRRLHRAWVAILALLMEGMWVFASFLALAAAASDVRGWFGTRRVVVAVQSGWNGVLDALPNWSLPFNLTLPQALARLVDLVWNTAIPGLSTTILLPLVWLALTATVFGWRDFTGQQVLTGERTERLVGRVQQRTANLGPLTAITTWVTSDLRSKYLPVVHALRLVWRSGPSTMAAYLIWTALLTAAGQWTLVLARTLAGDLTNAELTVYLLFEELVHGLVFVTLLMATYAAAFDRALLGVIGQDARGRRLRRDRRQRATDAEAAAAALDAR